MIVDPTQVKYELTVKDVLDFKDIVCAVRGTMCVWLCWLYEQWTFPKKKALNMPETTLVCKYRYMYEGCRVCPINLIYSAWINMHHPQVLLSCIGLNKTYQITYWTEFWKIKKINFVQGHKNIHWKLIFKFGFQNPLVSSVRG